MPHDVLSESWCDVPTVPTVRDIGRMRYLHFGPTYIQSAMRIDEPDALELRYTQKMMAFLLFAPGATTLLLLGLGGGSLAKFCYRRLPAARIDVVEIDPRVIALRERFQVPADDARFRVIQADGADYVAGLAGEVDVLLADAFDDSGMAPSVAEPGFFRKACDALGPDGILVMNLAGEKRRYGGVLDDAIAAFGPQVLLVSVRDDGNHILFCFKSPGFAPDWPNLNARARALKALYRLDFPVFVRKMQRAARLGVEATFLGLDDA